MEAKTKPIPSSADSRHAGHRTNPMFAELHNALAGRHALAGAGRPSSSSSSSSTAAVAPPGGSSPLPPPPLPTATGRVAPRSGSPPLASYRATVDGLHAASVARASLMGGAPPGLPAGHGFGTVAMVASDGTSETAPSPGPSSDVPSSQTDFADLDGDAILHMSPFQVTQQMMEMRSLLGSYRSELDLLRRLCAEQEKTIHRLRSLQDRTGTQHPAGRSEDREFALEAEAIHLKGQLAMSRASEAHYKRQSEELLALAQGIVRANVQISCEMAHYRQQLRAGGLPLSQERAAGAERSRAWALARGPAPAPGLEAPDLPPPPLALTDPDDPADSLSSPPSPSPFMPTPVAPMVAPAFHGLATTPPPPPWPSHPPPPQQRAGRVEVALDAAGPTQSLPLWSRSPPDPAARPAGHPPPGRAQPMWYDAAPGKPRLTALDPIVRFPTTVASLDSSESLGTGGLEDLSSAASSLAYSASMTSDFDTIGNDMERVSAPVRVRAPPTPEAAAPPPAKQPLQLSPQAGQYSGLFPSMDLLPRHSRPSDSTPEASRTQEDYERSSVAESSLLRGSLSGGGPPRASLQALQAAVAPSHAPSPPSHLARAGASGRAALSRLREAAAADAALDRYGDPRPPPAAPGEDPAAWGGHRVDGRRTMGGGAEAAVAQLAATAAAAGSGAGVGADETSLLEVSAVTVNTDGAAAGDFLMEWVSEAGLDLNAALMWPPDDPPLPGSLPKSQAVEVEAGLTGWEQQVSAPTPRAARPPEAAQRHAGQGGLASAAAQQCALRFGCPIDAQPHAVDAADAAARQPRAHRPSRPGSRSGSPSTKPATQQRPTAQSGQPATKPLPPAPQVPGRRRNSPTLQPAQPPPPPRATSGRGDPPEQRPRTTRSRSVDTHATGPPVPAPPAPAPLPTPSPRAPSPAADGPPAAGAPPRPQPTPGAGGSPRTTFTVVVAPQLSARQPQPQPQLWATQSSMAATPHSGSPNDHRRSRSHSGQPSATTAAAQPQPQPQPGQRGGVVVRRSSPGLQPATEFAPSTIGLRPAYLASDPRFAPLLPSPFAPAPRYVTPAFDLLPAGAGEPLGPAAFPLRTTVGRSGSPRLQV